MQLTVTVLQTPTAMETYVDVCINVITLLHIINSPHLILMITFHFPGIVCYISASCQSDEECSLTDKCLQGQCNNPCDQRSACGMNAECRVFNHNKQCSCPPGFTGNHDVECVRSKYSFLTGNIEKYSEFFLFVIFTILLCFVNHF